MVRLTTIALAFALVLLAATGAAAQMATPATYSEARSVCMTGCGGRQAAIDRCLNSCGQFQRTCMRSGEWYGRVKWSGLRRV